MRERRIRPRVRLKLRCYLQFESGRIFNGFSSNFSPDSVFVMSHGIPLGAPWLPTRGDSGILTLCLGEKGKDKVIKNRFRLERVQADGFAVRSNFDDLSQEDYGALVALME